MQITIVRAAVFLIVLVILIPLKYFKLLPEKLSANILFLLFLYFIACGVVIWAINLFYKHKNIENQQTLKQDMKELSQNIDTNSERPNSQS